MCTTSHRLSTDWYRTPYNQSKVSGTQFRKEGKQE